MMSGVVRLGLVGAGRWGRIYLRTIASMADVVTLAAVASANPETATLVPQGCPVYRDWRELLAHPGLDGVVIATPPDSHHQVVCAAFDAGLAVMVEKPLTIDAAHGRDILARAERRAMVTVVDHIHLFSPAFRAMKRLVPHLGGVVSIDGVAGNHGPYRADTSVLWDWGPHDVSMALAVMESMPDRVDAQRLERRPVDRGVGENLRLVLGFGAVEATFTLGTLMDKTRRFRVRCARGELLYDDLATHKLCLDGQAQAIEATPPLTVALTEFAGRINRGDCRTDDLRLAVQVNEILHQSAERIS